MMNITARKMLTYTIYLVFFLSAYGDAQPKKVALNDSVLEELVESSSNRGSKLTPMQEIQRTLGKCRLTDDFISCMKARSLVLLEVLNRRPGDIPLAGESLMLTRTTSVARARALPLTEEELERSLPNDPERLDQLLADGFINFINSHEFRVKLGGDIINNMQRSMEEARRKKNKGMNMMLMIAMMLKATLGFMAMGGVAALAGKALMVALLALMLSAIVGLKKLTGGNSSDESKVEVISVPAGHHGRSSEALESLMTSQYGENMDAVMVADKKNGEDAHNLAYRGYITMP